MQLKIRTCICTISRYKHIWMISIVEKSAPSDLAGRHKSHLLLHRQHFRGTKKDPEVPESWDPLSGVGQPGLHHQTQWGIRLQGQGQWYITLINVMINVIIVMAFDKVIYIKLMIICNEIWQDHLYIGNNSICQLWVRWKNILWKFLRT